MISRQPVRLPIAVAVGLVLCWFGTAQVVAALLQIRAGQEIETLRIAPPGTLPTTLEAARADLTRADAWWRDPSNLVATATLYLRMSAPGDGQNAAAGLAAGAREALERSLAEAPGNAKAWIWLADARLNEQGPVRSAIDAFLMSIVLARYEPGLVVWRCQVGLALYPALDSDGREKLSEQIRMLAAVSTDDLVRVARASGRLAVVVAALSKDAVTLRHFADKVTSVQ